MRQRKAGTAGLKSGKDAFKAIGVAPLQLHTYVLTHTSLVYYVYYCDFFCDFTLRINSQSPAVQLMIISILFTDDNYY